MKDILSLETFLIKARTADGYSVIVGGFCPEGKKLEATRIYSEINKIKMGYSKDEFSIDFMLANAVKQLSPNYIFLAGATIHIDGVGNSTGGVLGNPFEKNASSQEEVEKIMNGIYMISFQGGPGIAFSGTHSDAVLLKDKIQEVKKNGNLKTEEIVRKLDGISDFYIAVTDGCGRTNCGCICVSDLSGKRCEVLG